MNVVCVDVQTRTPIVVPAEIITMLILRARMCSPILAVITTMLITARPACAGETAICSLDQLKRLGPGELECLFAQGEAGCPPVGHAYGKVLVVTDARCPRLRARMSSSVWKGKIFDECGGIINQWVGFRAIEGHVDQQASWYDGRPCTVIEYAPGTPMFGNARDELREVGPGMYLGRFYEVCPCPKFRGYFALELRPECCKDIHGPCGCTDSSHVTVDR